MTLHELDERFVPLAAARVRRWMAGLATQRAKARAAKARVSVELRPADLDARFAGRGPFAAVREIPQIGFVLIAAVFMAGTATAVVRNQPSPAATTFTESPGIGEPAVPASNRLGPDVGQTTEEYERTSSNDLERVAGDEPGSKRLALVTFSDYRAPGQALKLLEGYDVRRVYLRAPSGGAEAAQVPFDISGDLRANLQRAFAETARSRLELQRSYLAYVATTKNDKVFQADYQRYADSAGREEQAYKQFCACVFGAIVEAPADRLLDLWTNPDVRSVQVAGAGADFGKLLVLPLQPETTGLVTKGPEPAPAP